MKNLFEKDIIKKSNIYVKNLFEFFDNRYFFHKYEHSFGVAKRAYELWIEEWLDEDELELLIISWLFHDTWFIIQYDENEKFWAKIAKNFLENIWYDKWKINIIENIILATIIDKNPNNIYEEIIKDSDLDNLWREDFFEKLENLKKEIELVKNINLDEKSYKKSVLYLIENYNFFTKTQKKQRLEKKQENIEKLKELIKNYKK